MNNYLKDWESQIRKINFNGVFYELIMWFNDEKLYKGELYKTFKTMKDAVKYRNYIVKKHKLSKPGKIKKIII